MPDWQPDWSDVAFDHGRAETAQEACAAAARVIDAGLDAQVTQRTEASRDWRGAAHDRFVEASTGTEREQDGLARALRALAGAIDAAAHAAAAEQARRAARRDQWRVESRREHSDGQGQGPR